MGRPNRLDRNGFLGLRACHIPFIPAFDAFTELAAGLVRLHFRTQVAALRTFLRHRLVPAYEIAVRVVGAPVERLAPLLGPAFRDLAAVLRADDARRHRPRSAALREPTAPEE